MTLQQKKRLLENKYQRLEKVDEKQRAYIKRDPFKFNRGLFDDHLIYNQLPQVIEEVWDSLDETYAENFNQMVNANGCVPDMYQDYQNQFDTWKERITDDNWVMHVLRFLGWGDQQRRPQESIKEKASGNTFIPDYLLFDSSKNTKYYMRQIGKADSERLGKLVTLPLEVKYWGRILDSKVDISREDRGEDQFKNNKDFRDQIYSYMQVLKKKWGVLTDGKLWRLYHISNKDISDDRFFQIDLEMLCKGKNNLCSDEPLFKGVDAYNNFKYFFLLFSPLAFQPYGSHETLLDYLFEESKNRASIAEKKLGVRFYDTVNIVANSIDGIPKRTSGEVEKIRSLSETHVFSILFILYCEARHILPLHIPGYKVEHSLSVFSEIIPDHFDPILEEDEWTDRNFPNKNGYEVYDRFLNLYKMITTGTEKKRKGFFIDGFKETLFSNEELEFIEHYKISNYNMYRILYNLLYVPEDDNIYQMVPISYTQITPEQMGSIYESMLEYKIEKAEVDMIFVPKGQDTHQWIPVPRNEMNPQFLVRAYKGELFLSPNNEERKTTGSYYTPDYIVKYIVKQTLEPLTMNKNVQELLKLRICDPAMGSGHFLNATINYLYPKVVKAYSREPRIKHYTPEQIKRKILDKCIYGVDINPNAVKLAKFALWLNTAHKGKKLERLDDQIRCGDSLTNEIQILDESVGKWQIGDWERAFFKPKGFPHFDCIIGNPPYINSVILSQNNKYKMILKNKFTSAKGAFDICSLFVEAAKKISPDSRIGFILPNKLMSSDNSLGMRTFIFSNPKSYIEIFDDVSDLEIFKDASVYPIIMVLGSKNPDKIRTRKHIKEFNSSTEFIELNNSFSSVEEMFEKLMGKDQVEFTSYELGEVCDLLGAATVSEAYEIKEALTDGFFQKGYKKFVVSGNILNFGVTWGIQKTQYIKHGYENPFVNPNHKMVPNKRKRQYSSEKLIIPNMTNILKAFYDVGEYAAAKSTTIIIESKIPLKVIGAYLNSDLATKLYRDKFESLHMNGGALRIGPPQLKRLPIPSEIVDNESLQKEMIIIHDKIEEEVKNLLPKTDPRKLKKLFEGKFTSEFEYLSELLSELNELIDNSIKGYDNLVAA